MLNFIENKTKKIIFIIVAALLVAVLLAGIIFTCIYFCTDLKEEPRVMGYYAYPHALTNEQLDNIHMAKYTHILFGFAHANKETGLPEFRDNAEEALVHLISYRESRNLNFKLILSIGSFIPNKLLTDEGRQEYAQACLYLLNKYNLDGIDIDWEFPATKDEDYAFGMLLYEIRQAIGNDHILSFAATNIPALAARFDNKLIKKTVDFVNVMCYDFSLEKQSDLFTTTMVMLNYVAAQGYKKSQLNVGVPFYGRSSSPEYEYNHYYEIKEKAAKGELTIVEKSNYSYAYGEYGQVTFDTVNIMKKKAKFVKNGGYGGIFTWHISCDDNNDLLDAMALVRE